MSDISQNPLLPGTTEPFQPSTLATVLADGTPQSAPVDPTKQSAKDIVQAQLDQYGLGSLGGWAWTQIVNGASADEVLANLRTTNEYKTRFSGLIARQKAGLPPMTEADAISYERSASDLFHQAGLPGGFYDSTNEFQNLLGNDVSINELTSRINDGYLRVTNAPPQVRQAYQQLFGASGDAALASVFLDPSKALPVLDQQAAAAEFAGSGLQYGFPISRQTAIAAGQSGISLSQAQSGFQKLNDARAIFNPTVGEMNAANAGGAQPLTVDQGVQAAFGIGNNPGAAALAMTQQQNLRSSAQSGGGGVQVGQHGLVGLGSGTSGSSNS